MSSTVNTGQTYGTYIGLTQQTFGPITFAGVTQPAGLDIPVIGLVSLYTLALNPETGNVELRDSGQQVLAINLNPWPVAVNSYVALTLLPLPDGIVPETADLTQPRYSIQQVLGCGATLGRPLNGPCPALPRTLVCTVYDSLGIPCADGAVGTVSWTGQYWAGTILLSGCSATAGYTLEFTPWLNIVLAPIGGASIGPSFAVPGNFGWQYVGVGIAGAGGAAGGAGGGAAYGYLPVTPGANYTGTASQVNGDNGSYVRAATANGNMPGGGSVYNAAASPIPGFDISGAFTGGLGSAAAGGGGAGTGGNGQNAAGANPGAGGVGNDGIASATILPAGGNGGALNGGAGGIVVLAGCASFDLLTMAIVPNGCNQCTDPSSTFTIAGSSRFNGGIDILLTLQIGGDCKWTGTGNSPVKGATASGPWQMWFDVNSGLWKLQYGSAPIYVSAEFACAGPYSPFVFDPTIGANSGIDPATLWFTSFSVSAPPFGVTGCITDTTKVSWTLVGCGCNPFELVFQVNDGAAGDCGSYTEPAFFLVFTEP